MNWYKIGVYFKEGDELDYSDRYLEYAQVISIGYSSGYRMELRPTTAYLSLTVL